MESNTLYRNITIAIIAVTICCLGFYLYMFNNGLSNDSNSWSNFGDYVNGILTPIFTVINIYVFVKLTTAISRLEEKRSEKELQHEKELLLMQFRKQEIDVFIKQTNRIYDEGPLEDWIASAKQVADYLQAFENTGFKWFDIKKPGFTNKVGLMRVKMRLLIDKLENDNTFDTDIYSIIRDVKAEITNTLMEATLGNTEDKLNSGNT